MGAVRFLHLTAIHRPICDNLNMVYKLVLAVAVPVAIALAAHPHVPHAPTMAAPHTAQSPTMATATPRPHQSVQPTLTCPSVSRTPSTLSTRSPTRSLRTLSSLKSTRMWLTRAMTTWWSISPLPRRPPSTTATTLVPPRAPPPMTPPTGLDPRATSAPLTLGMPRSGAPSMSRATGGSSCSTSPRSTDMDTTTTLRPPAWRPARPPTQLAVSWPPATSPSAPRSMSTTGWSLSTLVTPTGDSSSTPTSCHLPALAISPSRSHLTPTQTIVTMTV